jgi:hypothetical protein
MDNPDKHLPSDIGSITYVACTRVRRLQDLFVGAIFPSLWDKMTRSADFDRMKVESELREAAGQFASQHGMYREVTAELGWQPTYNNTDEEWAQLQAQTAEPTSSRQALVDSLQAIPDDDLFTVTTTGFHFPFCLKPATSERHIGIDQGRRNFAIAVVDKYAGQPPKLVSANLYDLHLPARLTALDILLKLKQKTDLQELMQQTDDMSLPHVDRVVVHIEQMCTKNPNWKQFGALLGEQLQRSVHDVSTCIVKLSQPNIHRQSGPMFKIGDLIVEQLKLVPATYGKKRARPTTPRRPSTSFALSSQPSHSAASPLPMDVSQSSDEDVPLARLVSVASAKRTTTAQLHRVDVNDDDVEPSSHTDNSDSEPDILDDSAEYRHKKQMSARVFRYFMDADDIAQENLGIVVEAALQRQYQTMLAADPRIKLDDLGDALLHALNELLCGGSNYRQLVPASSSLQCNRSVVVLVQPTMTYWTALHVTWNKYELLDFGCYQSSLRYATYNLPSTIHIIKSTLDDNLRAALTSTAAVVDEQGNTIYPSVDHIKMIVKQTTGFKQFTSQQAGALTQSTASALKQLCTESVGTPHQLSERRDKIFGSLYIETNLATGQKYQVVRSAGKHTNALLAFPNWMQENDATFVEKRTLTMDSEDSKIKLFTALQTLACSTESQLEMLHLSKQAQDKLVSIGPTTDDITKHVFVDLLLIGINKNEQHVKSIAANYRKITPRLASTPASDATDNSTPRNYF